VSPGLERVAVKARNDKQCKFTSLAHHITPELLIRNVNKIPLSSGSGVDGKSVLCTRKHSVELAAETISEIHRHGYRPPPVKRVYIPKPGKSKKRPIGIPNVWDRAVQRSCANILEAIFEEDFCDFSYGGRPKRNCHQAIGVLSYHAACSKTSWVFEADIKNFFGNLDHERLLEFVSHRVGDPRILCLIRRWLKAGVMEGGKLERSEVGTPQGGSISVVLSNIYLHYVLDLWFEKVVKPRLSGEAHLIRYLDDFVVCFQHHSDARRFRKALEGRLAKFNLELEPSKTKTIRMGKFAARDSKQFDGKKPPTLTFLGFTLFGSKYPWGSYAVGFKPASERVRRFLQKLKEDLRRIMHFPMKAQQTLINQKLRGFYNYFGLPLCSTVLNSIFEQVKRIWKKSLSRRSNSGRVNWEKFNKILSHFPLLRPKLKYTVYEFSVFSRQQAGG